MSEPITNLEDQLKRDEGVVYNVYLDSRNIRTGGIGHNLVSHNIDWPVGTPIDPAVVDAWFEQDSNTAKAQLALKLPWTSSLSPIRLAVLQNMVFNMGIEGLLQFHHTLALVEAGNYIGAAQAMLESLWAKQVGQRAVRLSDQLKTDQWV